METVRAVLLYFVSFGAMLVMFGSVVGIGLWLLKSAWRTDTEAVMRAADDRRPIVGAVTVPMASIRGIRGAGKPA
jgi:hypothetical protein